tara:strand:+ start:151 stop:993 length:843 start_codon:yes stop_codon:yes gene_type:complete
LKLKSIINPKTTIIKSYSGWKSIDWMELWDYQDLFYFLILRDIKTRYAQSVLGIGWAVIQPLFSMVIFTIVFGNLAQINSDGVPYAIFSYTALVPWIYFSSSLNDSTRSLLSSTGMITKVYFPRLVIPLVPVLSKLVDFGIAFIIILIMMVYYSIIPSLQIIYLPLLIILMMITVSGMGMWLTALAIQYRDINYAMGFFIQLLMYLAPVVYPASRVPENFRLFYAIFPMTGVIEGFRSIFLKTNPIPWDLIMIGFIVALVTFISGGFYFKRMEKHFADVA